MMYRLTVFNIFCIALLDDQVWHIALLSSCPAAVRTQVSNVWHLPLITQFNLFPWLPHPTELGHLSSFFSLWHCLLCFDQPESDDTLPGVSVSIFLF